MKDVTMTNSFRKNIFLYLNFNVLLAICFAESCPWATPTEDDNQLKCNDGTFCNIKSDGWACCAHHGGRIKCPKGMSIMCAAKICVNNTDHCCSNVRGWNGKPACAGKFGGPRSCNKNGIMPHGSYYFDFCTGMLHFLITQDYLM